jgi:murein DD-endopeptidase MepM/ murein hydrolase activator NlpD
MEKETWKQRLKKVFNKKRLIGFVDKFGFYLILLVCLGIIGVTAILTRGGRGNQPITGEDQNPSNVRMEEEALDNAPENDIDIIITDITDEESAPANTAEELETGAKDTPKEDGKEPPSHTEDDTEASSKDNSEDTGKKTEEEDVPASAMEQSGSLIEMAMPVSGQVIRSYSAEELVYSPTLKEWTTHTGIDIAGPLGGEVRAALDGVVDSIIEDPLKGIVIILAHDNDLKTVYTGLSTDDMIRVGQQIQKGQVISGIGRTAAFEILDDPHLHFEVLLNGERQDPMNYLKIE